MGATGVTEAQDPKGRVRRVAGILPAGSSATSSTIAGTLLLNAVAGILSARLLGPSGKGTLALAFVWGGLVTQLADVGIPQALTFWASREPVRIATLWGQSLLVAGMQSAIAVPIAVFTSRFLIHSSSARLAVVVALLSLPASLVLGYELSLLRGAERFSLYNAIRLGQAAGWTGGVVAFSALSIPSSIGLVITFFFDVFACVLVAGALLWHRFGRPRFARRGLLILFQYGVLVWIAGIGYQTNFRIDQFILGSVVAAAALGQYAVAVSLASLLTIVSAGIATVTLPAVARARASDALALGRRNWLVGIALMSVGAALLALLAPTMITGLLGQSFRPAVVLLRVLLIGQVALGSTQILHEVARGQGRLKYPAVVETAGAVVTVLMLLYAVPRWGALGAAWVSVVVYWPVTAALWMGILRCPWGGRTQGEAAPGPPPDGILPAG